MQLPRLLNATLFLFHPHNLPQQWWTITKTHLNVVPSHLPRTLTPFLIDLRFSHETFCYFHSHFRTVAIEPLSSFASGRCPDVTFFFPNVPNLHFVLSRSLAFRTAFHALIEVASLFSMAGPLLQADVSWGGVNRRMHSGSKLGNIISGCKHAYRKMSFDNIVGLLRKEVIWLITLSSCLQRHSSSSGSQL